MTLDLAIRWSAGLVLFAGLACGPAVDSGDRAEDLAWRAAPAHADGCAAWQVGPERRWLVDASGEPVFVLGDAAWAMPWKLGRSEIVDYLDIRRAQGFNLVGLIGFSGWHTEPNVYGDRPFVVRGGDWDFTRPVTTPGDAPQDAEAYDYWDHLRYLIDRACERQMHVILAPIVGDYLMGSFTGGDASRIAIDADGAYAFGRFIGEVVGDRPNVIWNLGNDRNAINATGDHRAAVRAMAEGIADGVEGVARGDRDGARADWQRTMMTFWPRKTMSRTRAWNSSEWFHDDPWLDFNSIQDWAWDAYAAMREDRARRPTKPTWLFEGRYERYTPSWTAWHARYQAWQSIFDGGFGHVFGNEVVIYFGAGWGAAEGDDALWRAEIRSDGARQMGFMKAFFDPLWRADVRLEPDENLVLGERGHAGTFTSSRRAAMTDRRRERALVYSADGSGFEVDPAGLASRACVFSWFDPRTGRRIPDADAGAGTTRPVEDGDRVHWRVDPPGEPGEGNDWVWGARCAGAREGAGETDETG